MKNFFAGLIFVIAMFVLASLAQNPTLTGQQIPVGAYMTFVDQGQDASCAAWPGSASGYSLAQAPSPASSLHIYVNGVTWSPGVDYSINGSIITLLNGQAFYVGDVVSCDYRVTAFR
jgi:hypothetical protein